MYYLNTAKQDSTERSEVYYVLTYIRKSLLTVIPQLNRIWLTD